MGNSLGRAVLGGNEREAWKKETAGIADRCVGREPASSVDGKETVEIVWGESCSRFFFGTISINAIVSTNCMPKTCQTVSIRAEDSCPHQCKISKKCAVCRVAFGFSGQPSLAK